MPALSTPSAVESAATRRCKSFARKRIHLEHILLDRMRQISARGADLARCPDGRKAAMKAIRQGPMEEERWRAAQRQERAGHVSRRSFLEMSIAGAMAAGG